MLINIALLLGYIFLNTYAIWRIGAWIDCIFSKKKNPKKKIIAAFLFSLASSTVIVWKFLPKKTLSTFILKVGNYWLGFLITFITILALFDICYFALRKIKKIEKFSLNFRKAYGACILSVSLIFTIIGFVNADIIYTNSLEVTIDGKDAATDELNVVLIADLHMGYSIGIKKVKEVVNKINDLNPDVVFIAGDIFDNNFDALDNPEELTKLFRQLNAKYGVFAVYGNHDVSAELIGGFTVGGSMLRDPRMEEFLSNSNIQVLKDSKDTIADNSIYVIGTVDKSVSGEKIKRKTIKELLKGVDTTKPILVISHQPEFLEEFSNYSVDAIFSGHTHGGQMFPINLTAPFVWKNSHGLLKINNMYSFVTSGVGIYGPNMRTFTKSEIMNIKIKFS